VWRGTGAWSHAPGRSTAGASHEFDKSHEPDETDKPDQRFEADDNHYDSYQHRDADDPCDANDYYESGGAGQYTVTASCMRWST
jgi:hypothetical protein